MITPSAYDAWTPLNTLSGIQAVGLAADPPSGWLALSDRRRAPLAGLPAPGPQAVDEDEDDDSFEDDDDLDDEDEEYFDDDDDEEYFDDEEDDEDDDDDSYFFPDDDE